jgi:transcriptional regulator with XRE-family HTH domain
MLLRNAREKKGLSQRELSTISGVRQSQISRIEQGAVDLRLSSLIELARALELELALVPRPAVPAVQSIVRNATPSSESYRDIRRTLKEVRALEEIVARNLSALELEPGELAQLQRSLRDMPYFRLSDAERNEIRNTRRIVRDYLGNRRKVAALREALARLRKMRNAHAHAIAPKAASGEVRPAYTLDEDDDA